MNYKEKISRSNFEVVITTVTNQDLSTRLDLIKF